MATMAVTIEPYRKGCSFTDWIERLEYSFVINEITDQNKKAYLIALSGPVIFSELRLLYPSEKLSEVLYSDMVTKLKARLDKTESDLVQRMKFNCRMQQLDESAEDFVLSLKLQAEFCSFGEFKQVAIRDRILAGLRDVALRQRLLNEENLTLQSAEKLIATWEIAGENARNIGCGNTSGLIASLRNQNLNTNGRSFNKLAKVYDLANKYNKHVEFDEEERRPVKARLGYRQQNRGPFDYKTRNKNYTNNYQSKDQRKEDVRKHSRYSDLICDFCGIRGHIKRKCFKLRQLEKEAVNRLDASEPEPSVDRHLSDLLQRMNAKDSDSDSDEDGDSNWKRGPSRSSQPAEAM